MKKCHKCGAERHDAYVGIAFPVRRLCKCESRECGKCAAPAVFVEFQHPVTTGEPKLPVESNQYAIFSCEKHAPDDIPEPSVERVDEACQTKRKNGRPHIDPVWTSATRRPPLGSGSKEKVECAACNSIHELRERLMWNGTESECPVESCKHGIFTLVWEDQDA